MSVWWCQLRQHGRVPEMSNVSQPNGRLVSVGGLLPVETEHILQSLREPVEKITAAQ